MRVKASSGISQLIFIWVGNSIFLPLAILNLNLANWLNSWLAEDLTITILPIACGAWALIGGNLFTRHRHFYSEYLYEHYLKLRGFTFSKEEKYAQMSIANRLVMGSKLLIPLEFLGVAVALLSSVVIIGRLALSSFLTHESILNFVFLSALIGLFLTALGFRSCLRGFRTFEQPLRTYRDWLKKIATGNKFE